MAYINGNEVLDAIIVKRLNAPTETIGITENGEYDVTEYATANVNVASGKVDYIVTFKVDGEPYYMASCREGESVELPTIPTKSNVYFAYWQDSEGNYIEFPYTPTADVELTAVFRENNFLCNNSDTIIKIGTSEIKSVAKNNCIVGYYIGSSRTYAVIISDTPCETYLKRANGFATTATQFTYNEKTYYYCASYDVALPSTADDESGQNRYKTTSVSGYAQRILNAYFGVGN